MNIEDEYKNELVNLSRAVKEQILGVILNIKYMIDITPQDEPLTYYSGHGRGIVDAEEYSLKRLTEWGVIKPQGQENDYFYSPMIVDEGKLNTISNLLSQMSANNQDSPDTRLQFDGLWLEISTGRGQFRNKPHRFDLNKPPYKILRVLLERKNDQNNNDGEVTREELKKTIGIEDWETIKLKIRGIRRSFGISRKKNPNLDPFKDTERGYKLIKPIEKDTLS